MVENNPHKISTMGTADGSSLAAITDASDFPHTGLIKGLSLMARQNIVVKGSNNSATHDFNITQAGSGNVIQVAQGSYLRDGKLFTAGAANFTIGTTSNDTSLLAHSEFDAGYHLLVIDSTNTIKIRQPTAANKVPDYTSGDTIIAIIEITSIATKPDGSRLIQYLTSDKTENSVSIAYSASNTYTEVSAITGTNAGLFISGIGATGAAAAADDKVIIQDTSASDVIKSVTAQAIANLAPVGTVTSVSAGTGMTQSGTSTVNPTLNVIGGDGITASANEIEVTVDDSTIELSATDGAGSIRVKDAGVTMAKLANIATDTFIGRTDANAGVPKALSKAEALAILNVADGAQVGDITEVVAGTGLTGGATSGSATLNVIGGDGITANANEIEVTVDDSTIELSLSNGAGAIRVKDGGITSAKITDGAIVNADINASAGIDATKIANGTVTSEEFQHINTLSSNAQTQLNTKLQVGNFSMWIPAEAISPQSANPCGSLTTTANANAAQPDFRTLAFDKSTDEFAQFSIAMPKMWNEGTVLFTFYWTHAGSAGNDVIWTIAGTSVSNDEAIGAVAFGTAVSYQDTALAAKDLHIISSDTALTIAGSPAVGDVCFFQISRDANATNDDFDGDALLMGVKMTYTVDGLNDA